MTTKTAYTTNEITTSDFFSFEVFYQYSYATATFTNEPELVKNDDNAKLFETLDKAVNSEAAKQEIKDTVKFLVNDDLIARARAMRKAMQDEE